MLDKVFFPRLFLLLLLMLFGLCSGVEAWEIKVSETEDEIIISTDVLEAKIAKRGYVTGVKANSLLDKKTGARDLGFGLDIADWIMEPGSDEAYRDQLPKEMVYEFGNSYHGKTAKRSIEGPQICTQAKELKPRVIRGDGFVAIQQSFEYRTAAPGKKIGSKWSQVLLFQESKRFFISMQRIDAVNDSDAMFLRIDMPGHIKHEKGDSFSEVYLSYRGTIAASEFLTDFAPDEKFNYSRGRDRTPERFIRAYHICREENISARNPWLAGMTLDADTVSEAWCHQRGYVCMIEEFGGKPIKAGEAFSAAFVVGFFDDIHEMERVYDEYRGNRSLVVDEQGWRLEH